MRPVSVLLLLLWFASPAAAQPEPPVRVPPIEIATGVSVEHSSAGAVASVSGNLTKVLALTTEVSAADDGVALLGGARVGTGFWYDGKPPSPGRFFAQFMIGRQHGHVGATGTVIQPGIGADVIVLPHRGVSLHWSLDYKQIVGAAPERSGVRLVIGAVLGPRT
jgi:hypothetical protein